MQKYLHIFFDLDKTLWDFKANSIETLKDIYEKYNLGDYTSNFENFYDSYFVHNENLWNEYREGKITKQILRYKRFSLTLSDFGINSYKLANQMGDDYVLISPQKKLLFPYSIEILNYLKDKYALYIITNGFKEVQITKLKNCNLYDFFDKIFISEEIGAQKPNPKIFKHAINTVNAKKDESIMIGDDLIVDILGAKNFGIDQVFFNPSKQTHNESITFEINSLIELKDIL